MIQFKRLKSEKNKICFVRFDTFLFITHIDHKFLEYWILFKQWLLALEFSKCKYSQTCVQQPPLEPDKRGRYAEGYMKNISGK